MPLILSVKNAKQAGWPNNGQPGLKQWCTYDDLGTALGMHYTTDRHAAQYSVPFVPRRLDGGVLVASRELLAERIHIKATTDAGTHGRTPQSLSESQRQARARWTVIEEIQRQGGVPMVAIYFDLDGKADGPECDPYWRTLFADAARILFGKHPGYYAETRGGARLVYTLSEPFWVKTPEDAAEWTAYYKGSLKYIARITSLPILGTKAGYPAGLDPACSDWTRLVRLPHATRDGNDEPESRPTWGDLGIWDPALKDSDIVTPKDVTKWDGEKYTSGIFIEALRARGHLGKQINAGFACKCPAETHSDGRSGIEGSTVVYPRTSQQPFGNIQCLHGSCAERITTSDWLKHGIFDQIELMQAAMAIGLNSDGSEIRDENQLASDWEHSVP